MRQLQRRVLILVFATAFVALSVPLIGLRARAAGPAATGASLAAAKSSAANAAETRALAALMGQDRHDQQSESTGDVRGEAADRISAQTLKALGMTRVANPAEASARLAQKLKSGKRSGGGDVSIQSGQPLTMNAQSALSAALLTTIGGRDNQFSEVTLIADWDGREDCAADREQKVDDFSFSEAEIDQSLTRTAISEHTFANGFLENVYYYGDSVGNLWVGTDTNPGTNPGSSPSIDVLRQVNIPALYNTGTSGGFTLAASGCTDDQVAVTGIAVNPVADLADFGLCGTIGEVVYVSIFDSEGCESNGAGNVFRTRILAFAFTDGVGAGAATPAGVRQILESRFANIAGVAVDDDGSLYYQLLDLIQFTGGAIFKAAEVCRTTACTVDLGITRINRTINLIPDPPTLNSWNGIGAGAGQPLTANGVRNTNYGGGNSNTFANIVSLASGGCNVLYAAVSRSFVAGPPSFEQLTMSLFPAPTAFGAAGTPSMVISFADCSGLFDVCSGQATGSVSVNVGGILPVADGIADVAQAGTTRSPGVNNFRIFVQGAGPSLAPAAGGTAVVPGTPSNLLSIVDLQIDYTAHSGLAVNEQNTVFVISGGTPAGIGKNPSPMLGEVLCFEDGCPADRRADFVDLRADVLPNPPASGGNVGDGDSDRFDHIFYQAPLDQITLTPGGLAGLADGFLRYTNRLAPNPLGPGVTLGVTERTFGDDDSTDPDTSRKRRTGMGALREPGSRASGGRRRRSERAEPRRRQ